MLIASALGLSSVSLLGFVCVLALVLAESGVYTRVFAPAAAAAVLSGFVSLLLFWLSFRPASSPEFDAYGEYVVFEMEEYERLRSEFVVVVPRLELRFDELM